MRAPSLEMSDAKDIAALVRNIRGDDDSSRKLAAFHLQSLVGHQDFAEALVRINGMSALCAMVLHESGNTLAYALGTMNGILEKGLGWDKVSIKVAERAVDLIVSKAVVNVLRNALRLLVLIASRPIDFTDSGSKSKDSIDSLGGDGPNLDQLKPILTAHPNLLEALVERLTSADHALCANALQFLNALLEDALATFTESQFMRFVKRLQDLQVSLIIEGMMHGDMVDEIAGPVFDFYNLTRVILQHWSNTAVDLTRPMHRDALSIIQRCARQRNPQMPAWQSQKTQKRPKSSDLEADVEDEISWRFLGFDSETPSLEFESTGLLGLIDLTEFAQVHAEFIRKALLEQTVAPTDQSCPIARVSLTATELINEHFSIRDGPVDIDLETYQPLIMSRDKIHGAIVHAFFRLWDATGATCDEYEKIEQLTGLLVAKVLGDTDRQATIQQVEDAINRVTLEDLRSLQVETLDRSQSNALGDDLSLLKERVHAETMHFVVEQRINCLLDGGWFPIAHESTDSVDADYIRPAGAATTESRWRFVRLSANRKYLHHIVLHDRTRDHPATADMDQRINVNHISSVVSSVMQGGPATETNGEYDRPYPGKLSTNLTIHGNGPIHGPFGASQDERVLLELPCADMALAAEWLDGLLMLLDQAPITADTTRLITTIEDWGLRVRLLNLQAEDIERRGNDVALPIGRPEHEGEYWYDMGEE